MKVSLASDSFMVRRWYRSLWTEIGLPRGRISGLTGGKGAGIVRLGMGRSMSIR